MFIYDNEKNRLVQYQSDSGFNLQDVCKLFSTDKEVSHLQLERYDNDNYEMMDKERIVKEDAAKQLLDIDEAQLKLNNFQAQKHNSLLTKRSPPSNPDELVKQLHNFKEDLMIKQKQDDYFLNDYQYDLLKPLVEHSHYENHSIAPIS